MSKRLSLAISMAGILSCTIAVSLFARNAPEQPAIYAMPDGWIAPGRAGVLETVTNYSDNTGQMQVILQQPVDMATHPFFQPLGLNGRACVTCHQPSDGMSLSVSTIQAMWDATSGTDPLFAAIDGSNCPTLDQKEKQSHSLLLERGLFRIQMPWPPAPRYGKTVTPDFSISVVRDPWGCNSSAQFGLNAAEPTVSVYRRPRPVANLKYLKAVGFAYDPKQGIALPRDEETGEYLSGNFMADNRATTLEAQMKDASRTHLQMLTDLTDEQRKQIEAFEMQVFAAQRIDNQAGDLADGAMGGPEVLRDAKAGQLGSIGRAVWSEFEAWESLQDSASTGLTPQQVEHRLSIARGARIFREKMFLINDSAGINSPMGFGNPVLNSCVFCHNMSQMGNDVAPGQVDIGTAVKPYADPMPELPLFRIQCLAQPHPHYGREFFTTDPGFALVTGKCADVGKITLQSMRGLAGRAPYFSNGLASDLGELVDYYDRRYQIGYTEQERQDLINLMNAL